MRKRTGQSVTEYAILLGVAIAVFAGMQTYVKRGLQARIKGATDTASQAAGNFTISLGNLSASGSNLRQYEPYYSYSDGETYSEQVMQEHTGDGQMRKEIVSQISAKDSGAVTAQLIGNASNPDGMWDGFDQ